MKQAGSADIATSWLCLVTSHMQIWLTLLLVHACALAPTVLRTARIYANIGAKPNLIILLMRIFKYKYVLSFSCLALDNFLIKWNIELYTLDCYLSYEIIINNTYNFWYFYRMSYLFLKLYSLKLVLYEVNRQFRK